MLTYKFFDLSIAGTLERFYLMMVGAIVLGFMNQFVLAALWSFPIAISFILGMSIKTEKAEKAQTTEGKIVPMDGRKVPRKTA